MTLMQKVEKLVRYCGQYQSHGFMMDERNTDAEFHIELPEEKEIRDRIDDINIIVLTGEAGDGKSRILRNIGSLLMEKGFSEPCSDFSALAEQDKQEMILRLRNVADGTSKERLVVSANVGVFTQAVIQYDFGLMEELTKEREDIHIWNFEKRNLAENRDVFYYIMKEFLGYGDKSEQDCAGLSCPCYGKCVYRENIEKLLSPSGLEGMRIICNAVYLTGGHITFRELLSLLAYAVTFGEDCAERRERAGRQEDLENVFYYNIFRENNDILLEKISRMDPALKRGKYPDYVKTKEEYVKYRRRRYFEGAENQYGMLNVDYLPEFYDVLEYMNTRPFHYDTVQDRHPTLQMLKKGIGRMGNRGKSDIGLVVTDTPLILGNKIRTEFMVMQDISMIWHRYDIQIGSVNQPSDHMWNKFYLSYLARKKDGSRKLISLLIDYRQFRYLMMFSQDYYLNRNELTVEEYAVHTFFHKILEEKEDAYDSIVIRFDEKTEKMCDFSLTVHFHEDFFTGEQTRTVRIRKED